MCCVVTCVPDTLVDPSYEWQFGVQAGDESPTLLYYSYKAKILFVNSYRAEPVRS